MANADAIAALEGKIEKQAISGDFWTSNNAPITFDMGVTTMITPDSMFCVPLNVPYEFYMDITAKKAPNVSLTGIELKNTANDTVLAAQTVNEMVEDVNQIRDRSMNLNFKGVGTGDKLVINYTSLVSNSEMAMTEPVNFMWGVRQYTDMYDFRTDTIAACI